jgi:intein/homing endonuclease
LNEKFFDSLESEKPCYWLGFLLADGNAQDGLVRIRLSRKDEDHLHDLKNDLDSEHNIKHTTVGRKEHEASSLIIGSDRLERRLSSLGVSAQAKDKHLPEVGTGCVRHVVRGFFDGDGHVSVTKKFDRNHYALHFTLASKSLLQDVKSMIESVGLSTSIRNQ